MSYWTFNGENGLKGVEGTVEVLDDCFGRSVYHPDPDNPARLSAADILNSLYRSRAARYDFRRLFPNLLPEEQARLTAIIEENPRVAHLIEGDQQLSDVIQRNDIFRTPVHTSGRRGGKGGP